MSLFLTIGVNMCYYYLNLNFCTCICIVIHVAVCSFTAPFWPCVCTALLTCCIVGMMSLCAVIGDLYLLFQSHIVLQLIVSMLSKWISGIPNNVCPFPGTTKKLHILHLLLFSNVTLHMSSCIIVDWLYIFSLIFVSFVVANCSTVVLGK